MTIQGGTWSGLKYRDRSFLETTEYTPPSAVAMETPQKQGYHHG